MLWVRHETVHEGTVGLLYENGRFLRTLEPGRHCLPRLPWRRARVVTVDARRQILRIQGQEVLTSDALSVRLNVDAQFRVADASRAVHTVADYRETLYVAVQHLLRQEVQARTLDALLADRSALGEALLAGARPRGEEIGLEVTAAGVRDVILPGDVKRMLAQEMEALRAGRAALVAAREETAAMRARANTAQLLENSPVLLRLREIEALAQVAGGDGNTVVVALPSDLLSALRGDARPAT